MRLFLLPFLFLFCCFHFSFADPVILRGQITGLPEDAGSVVVVGIHDLVVSQRQVRTDLPDNGIFELSFDLYHPQDVFFRAAGMQVSLLLQPGDILEINWPYSKKPGSGQLHSIRFSGDGADRNELFVTLMNGIKNELSNDCRDCDPQQFLEYSLMKKERLEDFGAEFFREKENADPLLKKWFSYFTAYRPAGDLVVYAVNYSMRLRKEEKDQPLPDNYFNYFEKLEFNNPKAIICSQYIKFLRRDLYMCKRFQTESLSDFKEQVDRQGLVATYFRQMQESTAGLAREMILTRLLLDIMEMPEPLSKQVPALMESFHSLVKDKDFVQAVVKKYRLLFDEKQEVRTNERINILELAGEEEAVLPELVRQFAGKAIYIDIWSTWCAPCVREMKYYPKLMEKYAAKDLEFIFLAALSPENLWKNRINEYDLQGAHQFLLSDKQYYALEKYFALRGFPQHIIINREGEVMESKGPPVISGNGDLNNTLIALLDKVLSE